ncbi:Retrovirus-related Pol polyprotein from transposon TNT 1-94 [Gossypium australe]|uniref:Retrovirus-related Pol polyprotein from transposon TNT 1-94 n=1 Tax=Gossypium australe TaxID=47621 RepID=A0A5B6WZH6_9ROSI|nr:Retrovirus-related Pol polyprotein from transposon TNT 1-94 [Gossypium australe]
MLFIAVSPEIFVRIMTNKSTFELWNFLNEESEGDERIKEFELQKMKDSETFKGYSDKLLSIANKVRLLGFEFLDSRLAQKNFL